MSKKSRPVVAFLQQWGAFSSDLLRYQPKLSMADVGAMYGYYDARYFCRVFKSETGTTPTVHQKSFQKQVCFLIFALTRLQNSLGCATIIVCF
ncbi:MAG: AraC family transcriptional regulator [Clostridia bacterium]|nr:AraC family transcriptional regulator [Clostridia bacterium]